MLPIPSLGGRAALTVLIALAPALVAWLADRRLLARHDDPALPELIASRRRANIRAIGVAIGVMLVLGGADAAWGIPLLIAALAAAAYPVRTRLLGETWGFGRYLWYSGLSFIGGFGFWIALSYAPILVQQSIDALEAGRWPWIVVAAAAVAAVLLAWEHWYPRLWLWTHDARPLVDPVLTPRFAEVVRRAGTVAPAVYRVGPQGSRFVNAMALPSVTRPAVAMGDALLDLLDADEATAIFAHEVAHFDHFTPRRVRRSQLINRLLIVAGVTLPLVGALRGGAWTEWIGWVWPLIVLGALLQRAARSQQHETESDLRAAQLCGDPEALVRGLMTLHVHARIPRRYAVDVERAASHPSLVRRIQAIRGASGDATAAEQLGSAAVVRSTRPGSWAVLDEVRSYWLDGVPEGTSNELTSLRDAASSYRAVNYSDLVELRVDATGDTRTLRARTRMGDVWNVPIAREDVARVQLTLDVVDLRLGKAGPGPTAGTPKLIAIVMAAVAIIAGQAGIVLVPIALALWKAGPAVMAAMGAMSIARAILGLFEGPVWLDEGVMRLGLLGLMAIGIGALYVAYRMARAGDAHAHFRLTMGVLLTLTGLVALALVWRTTRFSVPIVGAPLLGTLATAVVGVVAALSTTHTGRSRPLAFTGLVAAVALATVSIDRTAWRLRRALAETAARATPESETEVGLAAHALRSSPNGAYFMVTRTSGRRRSSTVVLFGRVGGEVRELPAVAGEFVDDSRILLLDALERGFELRLEHVDSVGRATWVDTLSQIDVIEPRLLIDRDSNSWSVAGEDADTDLTVLIAGPIGQRGLARRIALPDTLAAIGGPIVFGRASTVMIPAYGQNMADEAVPFAPLSMLGGDLFRTVIWRVDGDRQTRVASFRGFPRCGEALGGAVACAATHLRATSLYTLDSNGVAVEIAQLPTEDVGVVTLGPGARVASMRFDRTIADIDLVARRLTRIALPPNTEFASEVRAGPGFVLTLGYGENRRAKVRKYRVDQAAAGPPSN